MGLFDSLLGRTRLPKSNEDRLFAMSTAAITLEASANLKPSGRVGIVFKQLPTGRFEQLKSDVVSMLNLDHDASSLKVEDKSDEYGFDWLVLQSDDPQNNIAALHTVAQSLIQEGLGDCLLACVFRFDHAQKVVYWIYGYKQASFYPFIPTGNRQRDNAEELRLAAVIRGELPIETSLERWYALWDLPV